MTKKKSVSVISLMTAAHIRAANSYYSDAVVVPILQGIHASLNVELPPRSIPTRLLQSVYVFKSTKGKLSIEAGGGTAGSGLTATQHYRSLQGSMPSAWTQAERERRTLCMLVSQGMPSEKMMLACLPFASMSMTDASSQVASILGDSGKLLGKAFYYLGRFFSAITEYEAPKNAPRQRQANRANSAEIAADKKKREARMQVAGTLVKKRTKRYASKDVYNKEKAQERVQAKVEEAKASAPAVDSGE